MAESFNTMVEGLKEKEYIRDTFGRYIDQEVARQLMSRPEATRLGGQKRWVAVMMSDVRGFTAHLRGLQPGADHLHRQPLSVRIDRRDPQAPRHYRGFFWATRCWSSSTA
jgi:hypothetical protein